MATGKTLGRPIEILLVEDSPSDALLTQEALRQGKVENRLHHVVDGIEALEYLRGEGDFRDVPRPDLILLDLNMPRMSGPEVLREIRSDEALHTIPIVVLTTSDDQRDVIRAYELCANCFLTKPVDMSQFITAMQALDKFWLTWVALPSA